MRHVISPINLLRYVVIVGVLSTLASAQRTLTLTGFSCQAPVLTCGWTDGSCIVIQSDAFASSFPSFCLSSSSIQAFVNDDGFETLWTVDSCKSNITADNGCTSVQTPDLFNHRFVYTLDSGGAGGGGCGGSDGHIQPICPSPIIVDTRGQGFRLTSASQGVRFDIRADGHPLQIAWTAAGSGNGFLALDRNHNGSIDDGSELFGNFTQQPKSATPNGFLALSEFDKPENGGNGDGIIDEHDAVFSHLVIWIDENYDGISQPSELHTLPEMGTYSLSLQYKESRRADKFGNLFRYRAKVNPGPNDGASDAGRWAVDVFLTTTSK
jgi:hypothetical protein